MFNTTLPASLTPPAYARLRGIDPDKVRAWIASGELRALNVATRRGGKPRFVIPREAVEAFEAARSTTPTPKPKRQRPQAARGIIQFFK